MAVMDGIDYPAFFLECFERLIGHEGGFTNDPRDPGNWTGGRINVGRLKGTKYGISAASYPQLDIEHLTLSDAQEIYYLEWWLKFGAEYMPQAMLYQMWQFAINAGPGNARRALQSAVKVAVDGWIGDLTIAAVRATELNDMLMRFNAFCLRHYTSLSIWPTNSKGWARRVAANLDYAAEDN
jgi:lysozyme family protein